MSPKQRTIVRYLKQHGTMTSKDAHALLGHTYYHGAGRHISAIFSRLVKAGIVKREKKGVFTLLRTAKAETIDPNQISLF